jgi:FkbM family methyltransferase
VDLDSEADAERYQVLRRLIQPNSAVIIDIGANEGQFLEEIMPLGPDRVYCFEPASQPRGILHNKYGSDHRVRIFAEAIDETPGTAEFYVTKSSVGSSLLEPIAGQESKWAQLDHNEQVRVRRLDEVLETERIETVHLLKIDSQGTDGRILRSAGRLLDPSRVNAVLIELNFHEFYSGQDSAQSIIEQLDQAGYFLAELFKHFNRSGWLWWADALFLPRAVPFAT